MIKYTIKKGEEYKGEEATIIKTGSEIEFSINNINNDIAYLEKAKKELDAQVGVQEATKINVERTHPHIADMTMEDLTAAYLYREATGFLNVSKQKLEEIQKQLIDYTKEKEEIIKQTKIDLTVKKEIEVETNIK